MAGTLLEARAIISAEDKTGAAFAAVEEKIAALGKASAAVGRVSKAMGKLADTVASRRMIEGLSNFEEKLASTRMIDDLSRFGRRVDETSEKVSRLSRMMHGAGRAFHDSALTPILAGAAGAAAFHATKVAVKGGASLESERVQMKVAGIPAAEIAAADAQTAVLAAHFTNVNRAAMLQSYKELRSVLLKPQETPGLLPTVVAAKSTLQGLGNADAAEGLIYAIKGAEALGRGQDPARFKAFIDAFVRAQEVMGKTIRPETMQRFVQQTKAAGALLSDRFINTTGMSLVQELGSRGGAGLSSYESIMSGDIKGQSAALWKQLGFVTNRDFIRTRTGAIKGLKPGHHIKDFEEAVTDPDFFVWNKLIPALKAHGYDTPAKIGEAVHRLYPNVRAANIVMKLEQQEESFKQHAVQYANAKGLSGAEAFLKEDPTTALNALTTSVDNLTATLTNPVMKPSAGILSSLASEIGSLNKSLAHFDKAHPTLGKILAGGSIAGAGAVGIAGSAIFLKGMLGGFGLKTSAVALDASAEALTAAAAKLGAGSVTKSASTAAAVGTGAVVGAASTAMTAGVAGGIVALDVIKRDSEHGNTFRSRLRAALGLPDPKEPAPWMPGGTWHSDLHHPSAAAMASHLDNHLHEGEVEGADLRHIGRDLVGGILSDKEAKPVELTGAITVTTGGKIDLTPEAARFLRLVDQLSIETSGPLKADRLGRSMPEASPDRGR